MNQKGFSPILVLLMVFGMATSTIVINKFISNDEVAPNKNQSIEASAFIKLTPSPQPSIPFPSEENLTPTSKPKQSITSRPSPFPERKTVLHFDYCKGETNTVYEDEVIKYSFKNGDTALVTKDDITCIEAKLGTNTPATTNSQCQDNINNIFDGKMWQCGNDTNCRFAVSQQRLGYLSNCK